MLPARPFVVVTLANILCLMLDPTSAAARARIGIYQTNDRNALLTTKVLSTAKPSVRQQITPVNRESFLVSAPTSKRPVKPVDLLLYHQPDEQPAIPDSSEVSTSTTPILYTTLRRNDDRVMAMSSLFYPPEDGAQMSKNNPKQQPKPPFFVNDQVVQHDMELSSLPTVRLPIADEKELLDKMATPQYDHSSDLFKWLMMVQPVKHDDPVKSITVEESTPTEPSQEDYEEEDYLTDEEEDYIVDETTTDMMITEPILSYSTTTEIIRTTVTEPPTTTTTTPTTTTPTTTTPMTTTPTTTTTTTTAKPKLKPDQQNLEPRQQMELEELPVQIPNPFLIQITPGRDRTADKSEGSFKPIKTSEHNYEMDNVYGESMYSNTQQVSSQFDMYQQNKPVVTQKPVGGSNFIVTSTPAGPPYIKPTPPNTLFDLFFQHQETKPASIQVPINNQNINPATMPPTNLFDLLFQQQQTNSPVHLPIGSSSVKPVTPPTNLFDFLLQQQVNQPNFQFPFGSGTTPPPVQNLFELLFQQQTKPPVSTQTPIGSSTVVPTVTTPSNLLDFLFLQPPKPPNFQNPDGSNVNTVPFRPPFFTTTTTTARPPTPSPLDIFKPQQPAGLIESQMGNLNGNLGGSPGLSGGALRPPFFNLPVSSQPVQQPTKPTSVPSNQMNGIFISTVRPTKPPSAGLFDVFQQQKPPLAEYQMGNSFIRPPVNNQPLSIGTSFQLPTFLLPGYYQMGGYYYYPTTTANLTTTTPSYSLSSNLPCPPTSTSTSGSFTEPVTTTSKPPPYWSPNESTVWVNLPTIQPPGSPTIRPSDVQTARPTNPQTVRPPDPPTISPPYITTTSPSTSTTSPMDLLDLPEEEEEEELPSEPSLGTFFIQASSSSSSGSSSSSSSSGSGTGTDISASTGFGAAGFLLFFFFIGLPIIIGVLALLNLPEIVLGILIAGVVPIALFLILGVTGVLTTKRSSSFGRRWFGLRMMSVELTELRRLEQQVLSLLETYPFREEDR